MTKIGKIDVKGAFIQTEMEGPPIYIKIAPETTKLIVELLPAIKTYVTADGILYCQLLKALYGCVQASRLWYNKLTRFLRTLGYEASLTDPCVMRKIVDGKISLLAIYVDDILVFVDDKASPLSEADRKLFHTSVAKLLYLSKRSRLDILTAVGFLCTRVTRATVQERLKLRRVLGYLKRTKKKTLHLKVGDVQKLLAYVDAAFAPHPDAKSQSGLAVFMGKALVFAASRKQKCVSKSPTDSELIALAIIFSFLSSLQNLLLSLRIRRLIVQ